MDKWNSFTMQQRRTHNELERYTEQSTIGMDMGILDWWKCQSSMSPCVARIARDYLAIPATSVPCERVFSSAVDLISDKRASLSEEVIRACMCLKSWWRAA
jgi:hypothetical protein